MPWKDQGAHYLQSMRGFNNNVFFPYIFSVSFYNSGLSFLVLLFDAGWDGTVQIYCITVKSNASEHTTNVCKTLHRWTKVFTYIICDFSMVFLVTPK